MAQAEDGIRDHCVTGVQTCALPIRSEEHTSELQSHSDLVCRLLLGLSPKAYRASPARVQDAPPGQRGRPSPAESAAQGAEPAAARLAHSPFQPLLRDHARYAQALALVPKRSAHADNGGASPQHYYLPVSDKTVHWGYLRDRKSTRLNSSHTVISYAVFCLKKKTLKFVPDLYAVRSLR